MDALTADSLVKRFLTRPKTRALLPEGEIKTVVPLTGVQTVIRLVEVDGVPCAVARIYTRPETRIVDHRLRAAELVERHNLDAPRILDVYDSGEKGETIVLEEYVAGTHPDPETIDSLQASALAETLASLHGVASEKFGPLGSERQGRFSREALRLVRNRVPSVRRWAPAGIERGALRPLQAWFRSWAERLDGLGEFSLIHDKPNRGNLIWRAEQKRFAFVDLTSLRWGFCAKDLVQVRHEILDNDRDLVREFLDHYFEQNGAPTRESYDLLEPFYHAYYHLSLCAINCRRRHKYADNPEEPDSHFTRKSLENWKRLMGIVESTLTG